MQVARLRVVVQQSYIEYYAANNKIWYRAPGCYAGLLKNFSSEPGGLLAKKVSGDPWSVHFGGSHEQATLHTGVAYVKDRVLPFCTISNSRHHNPEAIWTYLDPVLQWLEQNTPHGIRKLCVFSDGPATQYRQKKNFFAFCRLRDYLPDVNEAEWHFFEASHGKGAPDGIGGALKRAADRIVSRGYDLRSAKDVYDALKSKETNIKLFYVVASDVECCLKRWEGINLPTVPGTMAMYQLTPKLDASLATSTYREVSCLCVTPTACQCAPPRVFTFPDIEIPANVRDVDMNSTTTRRIVGPKRCYGISDNGRGLSTCR